MKASLTCFAILLTMAGPALADRGSPTTNLAFDFQTCQGLMGCKREQNRGSAVCVGRDSRGRLVYLTAGHNVRLQPNQKALGLWVGRSGRWLSARVLAIEYSGYADTAILLVDDGEPTPAICVSRRDAAAGDAVSIHGYAGGVGNTPFNLRTTVRNSAGTWLLTDRHVVHGVSGGSVILDGALVGIVKGDAPQGTGAPTTFSTSASRLCRMLQAYLGEIPTPDPSASVIPPNTDLRKPQPWRPAKPKQPVPEPEPEQFERPKRPPVEAEIPKLEDQKPKVAAPKKPAAGELPSITDIPVVQQAAEGAWMKLWLALMPALGLGGPIGLGIGAAGWLVARTIGKRQVQKVETRVRKKIRDRIHPGQSAAAGQAGQPVANHQAGASTYDAPDPGSMELPETETQYIPYPVGVFAQRLKWVKGQILEKRLADGPGFIALFDSLWTQYGQKKGTIDP